MLKRKQEEKYYRQLELKFQLLEKKDKSLVQQPSTEDILKHIDVDSDVFNMVEQ